MTGRLRDDGGQALVLIAAAMGALLLGVGLALDTGQLFVSRRAAQTAADAAAWAGATVLYAGGNAATAQAAATADATRNGYTADGAIVVTTASPPTSGTYAGDPGYIEVTITEPVATRFIPGSSAGRTDVTVRAVAGVARSGSGDAVVVTRSSDAETLTLDRSDFTVVGGGTSTNTTDGNAVKIDSANLVGTFHRVTGNVTSGVAAQMSPAPTTGVAPTPDPFASLAGPSTSALPLFSGQTVTNATVTLSPGVYNGLIMVDSNGIVRLNPGTYVFRAGLRTSSNGSLVLASSDGVLIYNTYSNYPAAPGGAPVCGELRLEGTGQLTLAARSTGSYAGMLFFQDRNCGVAASLTLGAATSLSGTLYAPAATLTTTASSDVVIAGQIVADRLLIAGEHRLTMNFTAASVTGRRVPALVE